MGKYTIDDVKEYISNKNPDALCLDNKYKTKRQGKMKFKCENGHIFESHFSVMKYHNQWCNICSRYKYNLDYINNFVKDIGKCLSNEYKAASKPMLWECNCGHQWTSSFIHIKNGHWCYPCSLKIRNQPYKYNINDVYKYINKNYPKGKCLSIKYNNVFEKMQFQCEKKHIWKTNFKSIKNGHWCPYCFYKNEQQCRSIIESLTNSEFSKCKPTFLNGLELDGYNEKLRIAFEYNGEYHYYFVKHHHRNNIKRFILRVCRDKIKRYLCEQEGIYLITIPYYITNKKDFIEKKLEDFFHCSISFFSSATKL